MKKKKLSERQRFMLEYIREFVRDHGYAPSIREIKSAVEDIFNNPIKGFGVLSGHAEPRLSGAEVGVAVRSKFVLERG